MVRIWLGLAAALALGAGSAAAGEWPADGPTCQGVYDALTQKKSDLSLMSAEARAAVNFDNIDFSARAGDKRLTVGVPDYQASD